MRFFELKILPVILIPGFTVGIATTTAIADTIPAPDDPDLIESDNALIMSELRRRYEAVNIPGIKSSTGMETKSTKDLQQALNDGQKAIYCVGNKVIYGCDDRTEINAANEDLRQLADSALIIVRRNNISLAGDNWRLNDRTFKRNQRVCDDEPFADQPNPGMCSAFLIGSDLVATAGHCVDESSLPDLFFVFDFAIKEDVQTAAPLEFNRDQVFIGSEVVERKLNNSTKEDWAVVRLDRAASNRTPVTLSANKTADDAELCVLGHPVGLPMKMACGAVVRGNTHSQFFTAPLDTYGGNSGSLVFNSDTKMAEGILVRGETDFVPNADRNCFESQICPNTGCRGEDVTRGQILHEFMQGMGQETIAGS